MQAGDRQQLRRRALAARDALSPAARYEKSLAIHAALAGLEAVRRAGLLLTYLHFRSEVETLPALRQRLPPACRIAVPFTLVAEKRLAIYLLDDPVRQLRPGYRGIPEPDPAACQRLEPAALEVVLVPGSAFDRRGGRLGYGGGYYDRFLALEAPQAVRIGLAFSVQMAAAPLPLQPHDQLLHHLVTEEEVLSFTA